MEQRSKNILLVITVITLIVIVFGAAYAYFVASVGNGASTNIKVTTNTSDSLKFEVNKESINIEANQENFAQGGENLSDSITASATLIANNQTNTANENYHVFLNIKNNNFIYTTEDEQAEIILKIIGPTGEVTSLEGLTRKTSGGITSFDITNYSGWIKIAENYLINVAEDNTTHQTNHEWIAEIYLINLDSDQQPNTGKKLNAKLIIQKDKIYTSIAEVCIGQNMAQCIKENYEVENTIYYHDINLTNGAEDNSYRYAGPSEKVNNFVCFGSEAEECHDDNLYRIIGVFDDEVKLIKYDYATKDILGTDGDYLQEISPNPGYQGSLSKISRYNWNVSNSKNDWAVSRLNKTNLNMNYLNNLGTNWTEKIVEITWNVGEMTYANVVQTNAKTAYEYELGENKIDKTYDAKIGLMYLSEYYYSASPENWTKPGHNTDATKDYRSATTQNWMYMGDYDWTISPSDITSRVFYVNSEGRANYSHVYNENGYGVRPTFFLIPEVTLTSGTGTKTNPFRIV